MSDKLMVFGRLHKLKLWVLLVVTGTWWLRVT